MQSPRRTKTERNNKKWLGLIEQEAVHLEGLQVFSQAMLTAEKLAHIDLLYNRIGEEGAEVLRPSLTPVSNHAIPLSLLHICRQGGSGNALTL